MRPLWVTLYLLAGLLGGLAMGYVLGHRAATRSLDAAPPPPTPAATITAGRLVETETALREAEARLHALDAELAQWKRAHQEQSRALDEARTQAATDAQALAALRSERDGLAQDLGRAERELAQQAGPSSTDRAAWEQRLRQLEEALAAARSEAARVRSEPAGQHVGRDVRLVRLDPDSGILALDQGSESGLTTGSRWWLGDASGRLAIELTEVRARFSIARPLDPGAPALMLATQKTYRLTPHP